MENGQANGRGALPWPGEYAELREELRQHWDIDGEIFISRTLTGGRSGAVVLAVDMECRHFNGHAILKLDRVGDSGWGGLSEADLHQMAFDDAPAFAAQHLPRLIHSYYGERDLAILSTIASGGLQYAEPWIDCSFDRQLSVLRQLSIDLLEDWNTDYTRSDGMVDGPDLLEGWLDYRLRPEEGGRLHAYMRDELGVAPDAPSLMFEGRWYPNPLAFATRALGIEDPLRMRAIRGHCHGDLHGLNVLVDRNAASSGSYHLIDLALYQPNQYLFYDHAYFEIATLINTRERVSAKAWDRILAQLRRFQDHDDENLGLHTDDLGLIQLLRAVRGGIDQWVGAHEANRRPSMESQVLLARVAAGLNFANKRLLTTSRHLAFIYAAANLKDYVRLNRLEWPKLGAEKEISIAGPGAGGQVETGEPDDPIRAIAPTAPAAASATPPASASPAASGPMEAAAEAAPASEKPEHAARRGGGFDGFLDELRRRNVIKVAGVYIVVGWLSMQVVIASKSALNLPDWTDSLIFTLLATGFVLSCVVAWVFELGPAGLQRIAPRDAATPPSRSDRYLEYAAVAGIVVIAAIRIAGLMTDSPEGDASAAAETSAPAIAVLPFRSLGVDDDSTFADGLTIELTDTLEGTGRFRMPGVTSSFVYKANPENLRNVGETLGVDYVVEGSIRRSGDEVRIAVRLIKTSDGFTVWTGSFTEAMSDLFEAQEGIAEAIGAALSVPLDVNPDQLEDARTEDPEAYSLFLEALPLVMLQGDRLVEARDLLEKSVAIEPDFSAAWAALSLTYDLIPTYVETVDDRRVVPPVFYRKAQEAALRAQRLDPDGILAAHAMANSYRRHRQWLDAETQYASGIAADPTNHAMLYDYAILLTIAGRHETAARTIARAVELDPLNRLYLLTSAALDWLIDDTPASLRPLADLFRSGARFRPFILRTLIDEAYRRNDFAEVRGMVEACTDCDEDLTAEALKIMQEPARYTPEEIAEQFNSNMLIGYEYAMHVGGSSLVLEIFTRLATEEFPRSQFLVVPWIVAASVGEDPRFLDALEDMGLVTYWNRTEPADYCKKTDAGTYVCGAPAAAVQ